MFIKSSKINQNYFNLYSNKGANEYFVTRVNLYHCCISLEILSNHKVKSDNGSRYKAR